MKIVMGLSYDEGLILLRASARSELKIQTAPRVCRFACVAAGKFSGKLGCGCFHYYNDNDMIVKGYALHPFDARTVFRD